MIKIGELLKLAALYSLAAKLSLAGFEPTNEARSAFSSLVGYLQQEDLIKIQEFYIQAGEPNNYPEDRSQGLSNLDALTDRLLQQHGDDEEFNAIYHSLDIINVEAEKASSESGAEEFQYENQSQEGDSQPQDNYEGTSDKEESSFENFVGDEVRGIAENVGYQSGEEVAREGGGSLKDTVKNKERVQARRSYQRHNPISRPDFLEKERVHDSNRRSPGSRQYESARDQIIKRLINTGITKKQAIEDFNESIKSKVQNRNPDPENEAQVRLEETLKYLNSFKTKSESPAALKKREQRKRNKIRKLYLEELIQQDPSANVKDLIDQIKAMPVSEIEEIGGRLSPEALGPLVDSVSTAPTPTTTSPAPPAPKPQQVRPGVTKRKRKAS